MNKSVLIGVFTLSLLFFECFSIWPVAQTLKGGFINPEGEFTLAYIQEIFANPIDECLPHWPYHDPPAHSSFTSHWH